MDFIERWLNISPDGGDGTWEWTYLAVTAALFLAMAFRRSAGRALSHWLELVRPR